MVREDLIASAVSFLQNPSVASSPLEKRKAFLQSKNLTQEEVDIAIAKAGEDSFNGSTSVDDLSSYKYTNQQPIRQPPPNAYGLGYGPYQSVPWGQPLPPELPKRDWRDWFIMATVTSGVSYGLYTLAKRYVVPLVAPPTPPQLEQDKSEIDASFTRAFALIDQLAVDTAAIKSAEIERTEKLDVTLQDVESVISDLKIANKRREDENRRIGDEVRALKELIPKALEGWKADGDGRLKELGSELNSLKKLVGNRVGSGNAQIPSGRSYVSAYTERMNGSGSTTPQDHLASTPQYPVSSTDKAEESESSSVTAPAPAPGINVPKRESTSPLSFKDRTSGRAAIPAWQMATASNKAKDNATLLSTPAEDGSASINQAGADA